jgi:hypothetical protein
MPANTISKRNATAYRAMLSAGIAKKAIETQQSPCGTGLRWNEWADYHIANAIEAIAEALMVLLEEK